MKHQNVQTTTVEIKDQQIQTETITQEQGTYILIFLLFVMHLLLFFCLQHTYVELKLLQRKHLRSHKKQSSSTLRAMDSSCVFQKTVCQPKFQKLKSVCKLVCLAHFSCLLTVNLSVQSTGSPVPICS